MMEWSPQCYIPSFLEIGPMVPEKIFERFLPYMGVAAILVSNMLLNFIPMYLKDYIQNLVKKGQVVSEKSNF